MPALLDEIISLAERGDTALPDILRKCLRLAQEIKNDRLKKWANQELEGYTEQDEVPAYRIIRANAYGRFYGTLHRMFPRELIVPVSLEESHRPWAEIAHIVQPVSALHDLIRADPSKDTLSSHWPPNMVAYYSTRLLRNCACHDAWQEIPRVALVEILDKVRNITLRMALEIRSELGSSYDDLNHIDNIEVEKVGRVVINNLGGNVALGGDIDASGQTIIVAGDRASLDQALSKIGLNRTDLNELSDAILVDGGSKAGGSVNEWIKSKAGKVLVNGLKVSAGIGQSLLTEFLMQHWGLKK